LCSIQETNVCLPGFGLGAFHCLPEIGHITKYARNRAYYQIRPKSGVLPNMPEIGRITKYAGNRAYYQICRKSGILPNTPEIGRITKLAYDYGKIV
jgi:hypothetical protein